MLAALITLLEVFGFFAVAAVIVGAARWWVQYVEAYDPDWHSEQGSGRSRW